jgi:hypothetical protein
MQNQSPSLIRVVSTDYPSYLSILFPLVFVGFTIYFFFAGNSAFQMFLFLSIGVIVVGIPILFQRYRTIASVFGEGTATKGVVTLTQFFRGRGRIEYTYDFQGQKQTSGNAINRNKYTRNIKVGQSVKVFVDPNNPKQAFIQEIYM